MNDKFIINKSSADIPKSGRAALEGDSSTGPQKEKRNLPGLSNRLFAWRSESPQKSANRPLIIGLIIVLLTFFLALAGPYLAPRDPLETSPLLKVENKYITPPYPLFTPGYPLGSDDMGRDLFSRLLWAVRPTLLLVAIVAMVRLVLGITIGMTAGWSSGFFARSLDVVIAVAISIPVIIVALFGIAAVGEELGIWAFIVGLSVTGWVGTARIVREQTRVVRGQEYIEAAHALGASNNQILIRHVFRQIKPLLWMLLVFEISATLMLTAALGFLGYYIGGDIWVTITDVTAQTISGMPELGQMLATTGMSILRPWPLVVLGAVVFYVVLGFNLLGEGLRRQHGQYRLGQRSSISIFVERYQFWFEENVWHPFSELSTSRTFHIGLASVICIAVLVTGLILWLPRPIDPLVEGQVFTTLPQNNPWSAARRDPFGSLWISADGPLSPQILWTFQDSAGFVGGPAVASDGTLYVSTNNKVLNAISPQGLVDWQIMLPATPVGEPAISEEGIIYVTDEDGGLSAIATKGEILWQYLPENGEPAKTGPIVSPEGTIYYSTGLIGRNVQAVSNKGKGLWQALIPGNTVLSDQLRLSPDGQFLFLMGDILDARDGSLVDAAELGSVDLHFVGADGNTYLTKEHEIIQWHEEDASINLVNKITWEHNKFTLANEPQDIGVTSAQIYWLFYSSFLENMAFGEDSGIVWLKSDGKVMGKTRYPTRNSQVIGVDRQAVVYTCGNLEHGYGDLECQAFSPDSLEPRWTKALSESHQVLGGALVAGRLYVTTQEGYLYAIGEAGQLPTALPIAQATPMTPQEAAGEDDRVVDFTAEPTLTQVTGAAPEETTETETDSLLGLAGEPIGPRQPHLEVFFEVDTAFSGKPVVGEDGTVYIGSKSGKFYALDPSGEILWEVTAPAKPVGAPAQDIDGNLYVVDEDGGLSALTSQGDKLWRFQTDAGRGLSEAIISPDGSLYYLVGTYSQGYIQAVSASGESLWMSELQTDLLMYNLNISYYGEYIFYHDEIFDALNGDKVEFDLPFEVDKFFGGEDGKNYLLAESTVVEWRYTEEGFEITGDRVLSSMGRPGDVRVTPQSVVWMYYHNGFLWYTKEGEALGAVILDDTEGSMKDKYFENVLSIDRDYSGYFLGFKQSELQHICWRFSPFSGDPLWEVELVEWEPYEFAEEILGGALAPGRLYISSSKGYLYLILDEEN